MHEIGNVFAVMALAAFAAGTLNAPLTEQEQRIQSNADEIQRSDKITALYLKQANGSNPVFQPGTSGTSTPESQCPIYWVR